MRDEDYIEMMCKNHNYPKTINHYPFFTGWVGDKKSFHKVISFIKSGIRIVGCVAGIFYARYDIGFSMLLLAEVFGVIEEIKE